MALNATQRRDERDEAQLVWIHSVREQSWSQQLRCPVVTSSAQPHQLQLEYNSRGLRLLGCLPLDMGLLKRDKSQWETLTDMPTGWQRSHSLSCFYLQLSNPRGNGHWRVNVGLMTLSCKGISTPSPPILRRNTCWIHTMVVINDSWKIVGLHFWGVLFMIDGAMNGWRNEWFTAKVSPDNPKPSKTYSLIMVTRDVPDGGCSFGFNLRAFACFHILCTYACSYAHVEAGGWHWMSSSLSLLTLFFESGSLPEPEAHSLLQLGWLSCNLLGSHLLSAGIAVGSCMGAGNPNLGVHACIASGSFTEPAPQPSLKS